MNKVQVLSTSSNDPIDVYKGDVAPLLQSFSRLITQEPNTVHKVAEIEVAQSIIQSKISAGEPVNFRGAGHSFGDHCISSGGALLLNALHRPVERLDETKFSISSGSSWLATEIMLNAHGRSAPVLSNWLHVTIAGTLSAGGYGWSSLRYGGQIDNIASVTLVDSSGELRAISPDQGDEWKIATSCSGRLGFVTDCTLTTVPATSHIQIATRPHQSIDSLVCAMREYAHREDAAEMAWAQVKAGSLLQFVGKRSNLGKSRPLLEAQDVVSAQFTWTDWLIKHSHREFSNDVVYAWSDYVLPDSEFEAFTHLAWQKAFDAPSSNRWRPRMRLLAMNRREPAPPSPYLSASRLDEPGPKFGVGVYLEPQRKDAEAVDQAKKLLAELLDECALRKGRPYLGSWHDMSETLASRIYRDDLAKARSLLSRQPNHHLMNPGSYPSI